MHHRRPLTSKITELRNLIIARNRLNFVFFISFNQTPVYITRPRIRNYSTLRGVFFYTLAQLSTPSHIATTHKGMARLS